MAVGLSNNEISRTIYINQDTIAYHVSCILTKLELHGRTEIRDWALTHRPPGDLMRTAVTFPSR